MKWAHPAGTVPDGWVGVAVVIGVRDTSPTLLGAASGGGCHRGMLQFDRKCRATKPGTRWAQAGSAWVVGVYVLLICRRTAGWSAEVGAPGSRLVARPFLTMR
jgi:hypothetical protein